MVRESWHVFLLNDSFIPGSWNNHCSNTPESLIYKKSLDVLSSVENLRKVKL